MIDFWSQFDKPYRLFSQFCDSDDWHVILTAVAGAVMQAAKPDVQIALLDVGCGNGVATETICEVVFTQTKVLPKLTVVEPSQKARDRIEGNLLWHSDGGILHGNYKALDDLPGQAKFDAIMFLHSTYYLNNFKRLLKKLVQNHLYPGGKIVVLVLPEDSSFFLGLGALPNCMGAVESDCRDSGLHGIAVHQLQSRFRLPKDCRLSEPEWKLLCSFFRPEGVALEEFKARMKGEFASCAPLDFQDCLVVGTKPAT